jgi:hypothetical protein
VESTFIFVIERVGIRDSDPHMLNVALSVYEYGVLQDVWTFPVLFYTLDGNIFMSYFLA